MQSGRKRRRHFPARRFFYHAFENITAPSDSWADSASGLVMTPADGGGVISNGPPGTVEIHHDAGANQWPAYWPGFGYGSPLNLCVAVVTDDTIVKLPIGDGSGGGGKSDFSVSWGGVLHILFATNADGGGFLQVNNLSNPRLTNGDTVAIASWYDRITEKISLRVVRLEGDGSHTPLITWNPTDTKALGVFNPTPVTRVTGLAIYGWAGFSFSQGLPASLDAGIAWALDSWTKKDMFLPPMWKYAA